VTRLPVMIEEISREWLSAALADRFAGTAVAACTVLDVIPGTSTKIRVGLKYNAAGQRHGLPPTLIVKGGFEAHSAVMQPMYLNEMRFYRDVQPRIDIHSPRCFFAATDPGHQSIIILEDLRARGVTFCHPLQPQSCDQVARRLEAMARYHAQSWNSAEFRAGGAFDWIGGRHEGWSTVYQDRYLEPAVWQHYVESPRGAAVSCILHDRNWMAAALRYLGEYHRQWPVCLLHGDSHLGNLYVEPDGTPGFFDAQVARGPWQLEVTYHLVGALDIRDRRRYERELLAHYLESLRRHGIDAPAFEPAWEAHRREIAYGLFIFFVNETRFQTEAVNTAYTARFGAAALDHDTVAVTRP
jgi:Ecdysteroid kinase-like family